MNNESPKCSVPDCDKPAAVTAFLHDEYDSPKQTFHEQDRHCPFLCDQHVRENEVGAVGEREPRGLVEYPYTNQRHAQGWTVYEPLVTLQQTVAGHA